MTASMVRSVETPPDLKVLAQHLVGRVYDEVDSDYLNGRLNVGELTRDSILAYERDGVQLEDAVDAYGLAELRQAVFQEIDGVLAELRKRAAGDEREHRRMLAMPHSY